jgi:hypothetical protein
LIIGGGLTNIEVVDNEIINNIAYSPFGGNVTIGMCVSGSNVLVHDNQILHNILAGTRADGMRVVGIDQDESEITVTYNIIESNAFGKGTAMIVYPGNKSIATDVSNNQIFENQAQCVVELLSEGSVNFSFNQIANNVDVEWNLYVHGMDDVSETIVVNCVIAHNYGIGLYSESNSRFIEIINSIFWRNSSRYQIYQTTNSPRIFIKHCAIMHGLHGVYANYQPNPVVYDIDPLFVDVSGNDFHTRYDFTGYGYGDGINGYADYIGVYEFDDSVNYHVREFTSGWHWVSFPRLVRGVNGANEDNHVDFHTVVETMFGMVSEIHSYQDSLQISIYDGIGVYDPILPSTFQSSKGYKFFFPDDFSHSISGKTLNPNTEMTLNLTSTGISKHWIGYFLPETQLIWEAIPDDLKSSYVKISSQHGTIHRLHAWHGLWNHCLICGNQACSYNQENLTISYGEMIEIEVFAGSPIDFQWQRGTTRAAYHREMSELFEYEELADYTPIYIELYINDLPDEIGVFINGVCRGASVVQNNFVEVLAYLHPEDYNEEIEIVFADKSKSSQKKTKKFAVVSGRDREFIDKPLIAQAGVSFYHISFADNGEIPVMMDPFVHLYQNYPNPFNPETNISFYLSHDSPAKLSIYNIKGQVVRELIKNPLPSGKHTIVWDGLNQHGVSVSSGLYFYRLETEFESIHRKMLLLK